jgi:hypothetical protein
MQDFSVPLLFEDKGHFKTFKFLQIVGDATKGLRAQSILASFPKYHNQ